MLRSKFDADSAEYVQQQKEFFQNLRERLIKDEQDKKALFSNYEYISWLEQFTSNNEAFRLDILVYDKDNMPVVDYGNAMKLDLFFEGIREYALRNGISPLQNGFGETYAIEYNGVGYYISEMIGQGTTYSCKKTLIESKIEFINFDDIVNNRDIVKQEKSNDIIESKKRKIRAIRRVTNID